MQFFETKDGMLIQLEHVRTCGSNWFNCGDSGGDTSISPEDVEALKNALRAYRITQASQTYHGVNDYLSPSSYINMPYHVITRATDDGLFTATVGELPGCEAKGEDWDALGSAIDDAITEWVKKAKKEKRPIPLPLED